MELTQAKQAMKELTMALLYLSRFGEKCCFSEITEFYAWKGYNFEILNGLEDEEHIRQDHRSSRSKRVFLTDSGMEYAKKILKKYGISDWK